MEPQADEATTEPTSQNSPVLDENNFTNLIEIGHENTHSKQGSSQSVVEAPERENYTKR